MTFAAGNDLSADELNTVALYGSVVARGRRTSNSTAASAEQSVLRVDGVALKSGNVYWIGTGPLLIDTSVANDQVKVMLRIDTTGASATTASTQLALAQCNVENATNGNSITVGAFYAAASDLTLSVLLSHARIAGTGNELIVGSSTVPIDLFVIDCGVDPGDTGVDL